jgi:hypothetical protein
MLLVPLDLTIPTPGACQAELALVNAKAKLPDV